MPSQMVMRWDRFWPSQACAEPAIQVDILLMGPVTASMRAVAGETPWFNAEEQMPPANEDLVIVVDTGRLQSGVHDRAMAARTT